MNILMLGAGAYGKALGQVLTENGHIVSYYDIKLDKTLEECIVSAQIIVCSIPSMAVSNILPLLPKDIPFIMATKGFLSDLPFSGFKNFSVISGPGFADEIMEHKDTYLTATDKATAELFENSYIHIDLSQDIKGVLMCGALKNIYAIGAGLRKLRPGSQEMEDYLARATSELGYILSMNGAQSETVLLSCGIGDLRLTCSEKSRNYGFGLEMSENSGFKVGGTIEGLSTLARIKKGEVVIPDGAIIINNIIMESEKWV